MIVCIVHMYSTRRMENGRAEGFMSYLICIEVEAVPLLYCESFDTFFFSC